LSQFYNAAGFADLILHATLVLQENPARKEYQFFIIDEYQDFNEAEEELIRTLTSESRGVLIVGDDDQVLYETLKSGKAELIRALYSDNDYVNAMLPYCSRTSSSHIVKTADHFIRNKLQKDGIEKIYLPIKKTGGAKIKVVACSTAASAVDYIETFINANAENIAERKRELQDGSKKDPFLLILSPAKDVGFYKAKGADIELKKLVAVYKRDDQTFSGDYFRILSYYSLSKYPNNNFMFRKVMHYEQVPRKEVTRLLQMALAEEKGLAKMRSYEGTIEYILTKSNAIREILEGPESLEKKMLSLSEQVSFSDKKALEVDLALREFNEARVAEFEIDEEDQAELAEVETQPMSAVELITIMGAKGLSADNVIVIGFDNVNMSWLTRNAFYVALTRTRDSLHLIIALKSGGSKGAHPFLQEFPGAHVEFYKHNKTKNLTTVLQSRSDFTKYLARLVWMTSKSAGNKKAR
jgi:superfamily I DNA/RNA helicase